VDIVHPESGVVYYQSVSGSDEEEDVFGEIDNELALAAQIHTADQWDETAVTLDLTAIGYSEMEEYSSTFTNDWWEPYSVEIFAELGDDSQGDLDVIESQNAGLNVYGDEKEGDDISDGQLQMALGAASLIPNVGPIFGVASLGLTVADAMHNEGLDDYDTHGSEIGAEWNVDTNGPYEELYNDDHIAFAFSTRFQWTIDDDLDGHELEIGASITNIHEHTNTFMPGIRTEKETGAEVDGLTLTVGEGEEPEMSGLENRDEVDDGETITKDTDGTLDYTEEIEIDNIDPDDALAKVDIDWGDGSGQTEYIADDETLEVSNTYGNSGEYDIEIKASVGGDEEEIKYTLEHAGTTWLHIATYGAGTTDPDPYESPYSYDYGEEVYVEATASTGWQLDYWEKNGNYYCDSYEIWVEMNAPVVSLDAHFENVEDGCPPDCPGCGNPWIPCPYGSGYEL